jgi:hypothetical protein
MVVSLIAAKLKYGTFSVSGFALSYAATLVILMILYDFCLLPAQFYYIIIYTWKVESCVEIVDLCAPWKVCSRVENLVLQALQFLEVDVCPKFPGGTSISH